MAVGKVERVRWQAGFEDIEDNEVALAHHHELSRLRHSLDCLYVIHKANVILTTKPAPDANILTVRVPFG